jgi:hypothetical protein
VKNAYQQGTVLGPLLELIGAGAIGAVVTGLIPGAPSLATTWRTEKVWVVLGAIAVLAWFLCTAMAATDVQAHRRKWRMRALVAITIGLGFYIVGAAMASEHVKPDMRATLTRGGHGVKITIAKDEDAADNAYVLVTRRGHEVFKDSINVKKRNYTRTVGLPARRRTGTDRVCVVATYELNKLKPCVKDEAVALQRFRVHR